MDWLPSVLIVGSAKRGSQPSSHAFRSANHRKAKKRKCLVSGYPTDPNILGPTQTFLKTFGI